MSTATEMLAQYLSAEVALLQGKEVRFGDRALRREDLPEIRAGRQEWEARVQREAATGAGAPAIGGVRFSLARIGS